jgi:succinate dehydrogenase / fumarate reductase cytochrome b subunit
MADTTRTAVRLEDRRPLSPHLMIYRPMLTMMMSIAHRITGVVVYVGMLLVAWYLIAAASGAESFSTAYNVLGSIPGQIVLFGFTWAYFHHFCGGLRHAIWDTGNGMEPVEREWLAIATLVGGFGLTLLVWIAAFILR